MVKLKEIKITGIDVSDKTISCFTDEDPEDSIDTAQFVFVRSVLDLTGLENLSNGDAITFKRGDTLPTEEFVFEGEISDIQKFGTRVTIKAESKGIAAVQEEITKTYDKDVDITQAGKGSELVIDMINNFTNGRLTASSTGVPDSGTSTVLKFFINNHRSVWEAILELNRIYLRVFLYDPTIGEIRWKAKGGTTIATTLTVGTNVFNQPKWIQDTKQMLNDITVLGAEQIVEDTELFDGTGSQDTFTLAKVPISVNIEVGGVIQVPGVTNSTSGFAYTVNKEQKECIFESGSEPAAGSENVAVKYTNAIPVPIRVTDGPSIATYGRRRASKHILNVQSVDDGEKYAAALLSKYKDPFVTVRLLIDADIGVRAGDIVRVVDAFNGEDRNLVVNKLKRRWPGPRDEIIAGDKEYRLSDYILQSMEREKRLEELQTKNTEIVVQKESFEETLRLFVYPFKAIKVDRSQDNVMIWGNQSDEHGKWNDGGSITTVFADASPSYPETTERVIWENGVFVEEFNNELFLGLGTAEIEAGVLK